MTRDEFWNLISESKAHAGQNVDAQYDYLEKQLTAVLSNPDCVGVYIWQFCDIRVNREWFEKRPRTRNNKGIVDEFRRRKLAYDSVKEIFGSVGNYWEER